ncbi:99926bca-d9f9-4247-a565-df7e8426406a [Thermothielavioides terrestris]|uniref:CST complex subunit STN1 n=2 Tax=Thermothielavioides terrestris TaxID=2587410 RepID=G2QQW6_THETT|nr:uncharacterized protein THITE_2109943 [Thermothielavioides terrestris NRRL 8126]AEO64125.1 hypothetical protein THITE_2109943 [Thermothielavioides terrestris NRRL 8126]SPQ27020.1 99926bca-d9f9-4247-a565-df7e8426406a [Thermothielavioides terrestris]
MTDATKPELYPQYCFHLSPTINRWCHFRIADIWRLRCHPGFQGQDVYFHLNHPIKWIRISGVVVAITEREKKHFYTIDDGSGATLECVVNVPGTAAVEAAPNGKQNPNPNPNPLPVIDAPIDVGHVLDIKGSVGTFRKDKQIRAEKIVHLRTTEQEVAFWEKVAQLKRDVLSKPWVLDPREVRRCRKEEEGRHTSRRQKDCASERHGKRPVRGAGVRNTKLHNEESKPHHEKGERKARDYREPLARRPVRQTGLEKRRAAKPVTRLIPVTGKYDALGL